MTPKNGSLLVSPVRDQGVIHVRSGDDLRIRLLADGLLNALQSGRHMHSVVLRSALHGADARLDGSRSLATVE